MTATAASDLDRAVGLFHALSDATRLAALDMLRDGEKCVCELQDQLDVAQSRLSFHLKVLKDAGLVEDRKEGRWSYYQIVPGALDEAHDLVINFLPKSLATGARFASSDHEASRVVVAEGSGHLFFFHRIINIF